MFRLTVINNYSDNNIYSGKKIMCFYVSSNSNKQQLF